jgi:Tfp pilus assembly protein FimT
MKLFRIKNVFKKEDGFTLFELTAVIAIVMILAAITGLRMSSWMGKARVEERVKRMYADFSNARMRAMTNNRLHFVQLNTALNQYQIWEDTNTGPDGNLTLETAADTLLAQAIGSDQLWTNIIGGPPVFNFNTKGLATLPDGTELTSPNNTVRIVSTYEPGIDCVTVSSTRIRIGRWDGGSATCIPK